MIGISILQLIDSHVFEIDYSVVSLYFVHIANLLNRALLHDTIHMLLSHPSVCPSIANTPIAFEVSETLYCARRDFARWHNPRDTFRAATFFSNVYQRAIEYCFDTKT